MLKAMLKKSALIMAVIMLLGAFTACIGGNDPKPGLPLYSEAPAATEATADLVTYAPAEEPTKAPAEAATEAPTAAPTAAPTPAPTPTPKPTAAPTPAPTQCPVKENGKYDSKDEVALYIQLFGHLPSNYITKNKARQLGWQGGSLEPYAPGCSIGGDYFGNYEGLLPAKSGRKYTECDIDTKGKRSRGAKRIIFSNDGLIYYTNDHYESFTLLYDGENWQ